MAQELAKKSAEEQERIALERQAKADAEERQRREVVDRAWRESQEYARGVAELKEKIGRRDARRAPLFLAAILLGAVVIGAVVYNLPVTQEPPRVAESPRAVPESKAMVPVVPDSGDAEALAAKARAEEDARKAAQAKDKALAARIEEKARRTAELEAKQLAREEAQPEPPKRAAEAPRPVRQPGTVFQDCPDCPRMVVIPAGEFRMGSVPSEAERGGDEGPQHQVSIASSFALGRTEVTVAEFRRFTDDAGYRTEAERDTRSQGCSGFIYLDPAAASPDPQLVTSWRNPGLVQEDSHPVLCVSWNDARAYAQWLSKKAGQRYRLPTEAEWEYAARGGTGTARYWGNDPVEACRYANVADQSRFQTLSFGQKHDCNDGHYFTATVGSYARNGFGLYDMIGNAWEWTEDCWNASYAGAPADGAAWLAGDCRQRVSRGGSWSTVPRFARSAARNRNSADHRDNLTGFRLARTLE